MVATPLGNLEDVSPRAKRLLETCDLILAEDTRVTRKLLSAFSISTPMESCHEHNEDNKAETVIARMLAEDLTVCLVSDAGTPAISDPGAKLVDAVHQAGIQVLAAPGPSAQAAALSVSGLQEEEFTFYGFLPRKKGELLAKLADMQGKAKLAVLYESPRRVVDLLAAIAQVYPGAKMSISREISKLHEQTLTGFVENLLDTFCADEGKRRGEFCLVLKLPGTIRQPETQQTVGLEAQLLEDVSKGTTLRQAMANLVANGQRKNQVYAASLRLKQIAEELLEEQT